MCEHIDKYPTYYTIINDYDKLGSEKDKKTHHSQNKCENLNFSVYKTGNSFDASFDGIPIGDWQFIHPYNVYYTNSNFNLNSGIYTVPSNGYYHISGKITQIKPTYPDEQIIISVYRQTKKIVTTDVFNHTADNNVTFTFTFDLHLLKDDLVAIEAIYPNLITLTLSPTFASSQFSISKF